MQATQTSEIRTGPIVGCLRFVLGAPRRLVELAVGRAEVHGRIGPASRPLLRTFSSPRGLLQGLVRTGRTLNPVATYATLEARQEEAIVSYRVDGPHTSTAHGCDYTAGLLAQAPVPFGLPAARVDHTACQVRGADACVYRLRWVRSRWRGPARRAVDATALELRATQDHLADLEQTAIDVADSASLDTVLDRIVHRASAAIGAGSLVLAVRLDADAPARVHARGLDDEAAARIGDVLLDAPAATGARSPVLPVAIRSWRREYGAIAAILPPGTSLGPDEHRLLDAHGRLAATALDNAALCAVALRRQEATTALLELAHALGTPGSAHAVSAAVAETVPAVTGADRSAVLFWDADAAVLRVGGHHGYPPELAERIEAVQVTSATLPGLLRDPGPRFYRHGEQDPFAGTELGGFDTSALAVVPIRRVGHLLGVVMASWTDEGAVPDVLSALEHPLTALADQAAAALEHGLLLERVHHQASHDVVTGLPNGTRFDQHLAAAVEAARRTGEPSAVLFVDLDGFKEVNNALGHGAGDQLLRQIGERLRDGVRESDTVARRGGDEFTILLRGLGAPLDAVAVAEDLLRQIRAPVRVEGRRLNVSASIGVALAPQHGTTVDALLHCADIAMYAAKQAGRARVACYDPAQSVAEHERITLQQELRDALERNELVLHYQPQVNVADAHVVALEALVRWQHPTEGLLAPSAFIPLAERTGLIVPLDLLVIDLACSQTAAWKADGLPLERLAVNVSPMTIRSAEFLPRLRSALARTGIPARMLELEITETAAIDGEDLAESLESVRSLGCTIAVDDLGTGYATLAVLQRFSVDRIKIDRSFLAASGELSPVVPAVITLGHQLGMVVVAEGVETALQLEGLAALGCDEAQGFWLCRPIPADEVPGLWPPQGAASASATRAAMSETG